MAEIRTEIDLLDSWFRIADRDGDGRIHGGEAVDFFQRSGLGKDPLFQVRTRRGAVVQLTWTSDACGCCTCAMAVPLHGWNMQYAV